MKKTDTISVRIDPETKDRAEAIFETLGLSSSQAVQLFYKQVELRRGLPFPVEIPNRTTARAIKEARNRNNLESLSSTDELFSELEI